MSDSPNFKSQFEQSWLLHGLYRSRNFGPAIHKWSDFIGGAFNTFEQSLLNGKTPINLLDHHADHTQMKLSKDCTSIVYPKYDNIISFDKLSSVYLSNTNH